MVLLHLPRRHSRVCRKSSNAIWSLAAGLALVSAVPDDVHAQIAGQSAKPSGCEAAPNDGIAKMALNLPAKLEPGAGPLTETKSAAILGGSPSKLEQMRMAQAALPLQPLTAVVSASNIGTGEIRDACPDDAIAPAVPTGPQTASAWADDAVLGSMSVAIHRTPFDTDWAAVSARPSNRKVQRALAASSARSSGSQSAQIEAVNRWVNRNIAFGEDRDVYGRADYWAPAAETLRRGIGDCEDFAIAKMELLAALGIARNKMRLVVARDLARNADHAVLVVTMADGAVMLDNMTDRLMDARLPNDYRPIMSFSQNAKWVHGYAAQQPQPVRMALASPVPQPAANRMADVLTVTAEGEMPILSMALLSVPLVLPNGLSARA